jgi:hypothetical protein
MCVYGHLTDPIFQPPTLIGSFSTFFALNFDKKLAVE